MCEGPDRKHRSRDDPLKTIVVREDGTGSATTTLEGATVEEILDPAKSRYVALHSKVEE